MTSARVVTEYAPPRKAGRDKVIQNTSRTTQIAATMRIWTFLSFVLGVVSRRRRPVQLLRQVPPLHRRRVLDQSNVVRAATDDDSIARRKLRRLLPVAEQRRARVHLRRGDDHIVP